MEYPQYITEEIDKFKNMSVFYLLEITERDLERGNVEEGIMEEHDMASSMEECDLEECNMKNSDTVNNMERGRSIEEGNTADGLLYARDYKFGISTQCDIRIRTHCRKLGIKKVIRLFNCVYDTAMRNVETAFKQYAAKVGILVTKYNQTEIITTNNIDVHVEKIRELLKSELERKHPENIRNCNNDGDAVVKKDVKIKHLCDICGEKFRTPADLLRHKNRKTPCVMREVKPEDVKNPNRCIYCNKIMSTIGNLTKHLKTCKVKNGGLQMLHDKVKHEEQMRVLQEEHLQKTNNLEKILITLVEKQQEVLAKIDALQEENNKLRAGATVGANGIAVNGDHANIGNTNNTFNIVVNNYNNPNVEHLKDVNKFSKLLHQQMSATPLALVEQFWFDPEHPENISIHLINKKNGEVLVSAEGKWVTDNTQNIIPVMRQIVYDFTQQMMREHPDELITLGTDMVPATLARNITSEKVIKMDSEDILQALINGRQVSQVQIDRFKQLQAQCKLVPRESLI